jgi:hypothetical protein
LENIILDSSRNYNIEVKKRNENIIGTLESNLQTQFQPQKKKSGKMLKMINKNHNKEL